MPSPGEVRKLMLAYAILSKKVMIIMDEPTNHMDLPSIKCVGDALANYYGSLILVSHDNVFLNNIINHKWIIKANGNNNFFLNINGI
jgi:ATPase subunit of ABC transporter with duplicated ATPase domains